MAIVPDLALSSCQCLGDGKEIKKTGALESIHVFSEAKNGVRDCMTVGSEPWFTSFSKMLLATFPSVFYLRSPVDVIAAWRFD